MKRRDLIGAAGVGAAVVAMGPGAAAGAAKATAAGATGARPLPKIPPVNPAGKLLVNKPRAYEVMARLGLDGLIAANPLNVYYLANTITLGVKFRSDPGGYATLPRDPSQPSFFVCTTAETWDIANQEREIPETIFYTSAKPGQSLAPGVEPEANRPRDYAHVEGGPFTAREQRWIAAQDKANASVAPGAAWALVRALKRSGMTKGRIGVDDLRTKLMLDDIGFTGVTFVPADDVFKLIRMVKTAPEIDLMRIAGHNNEAAAMAAMRRMQPGMRFADFENLFRQECADRGSMMTSIILGMPGGMTPDEEAVRSKPYIVDAVSTFGEYSGDFARTLVLGEPTKEILFRAKANRMAREAVFEIIKPGVPFATLRDVAFNTMVKAGIPAQLVFVTPHSVGLSHSDQPFRLAGFDDKPIQHVLEENMVLTIDLPYIEVGWGGGHNEDLFRVTRTGYEALNPESDPLVVV
jgi:Xaa-Pro aminopeptidase